jgi:hypothetical protein
LALHLKERMVTVWPSGLPTARKASKMPFICYIHRKGGGVPHFEVLPEMTAVGAQVHAVALLAQRIDATRAEVWDGDTLLFTVPPAAALAAP